MHIRILLIFLFAACVMSCHKSPANIAQGYVEGRYTYIATSVPGILKTLFVARGNTVRKGDTLFMLESQPESDLYHAALQDLQESIAAKNAIVANLEYAKITYERYKYLVSKNAIQQAQLDNAKSVYNSTLAQLTQANANIASTSATLAKTKWTLDQKQMKSPVDGIVFDTYYRIGEYTEANKSILSLLAPADVKAIFYVPEAVLAQLQLGDIVKVNCNNCRKTYTAHITFISPTAEYTPPVIYSNETNEKLIFRMEAAFNPKEALELHPGQPINVSYQLLKR